MANGLLDVHRDAVARSDAVQPSIRELQGRSDSHPSVSILSDADEKAWDDFVTAHESGTLFHTLAWRNAVQSSFKHEAHYFIAKDRQRVVGVLPTFLVYSRLGGRLLVSVPYAVGGGILTGDDHVANCLFEQAKSLAHNKRCRCIDFRSKDAAIDALPCIDRYVGFSKELPADQNAAMLALPRKARAAARNAQNKYDVQVIYGDEQLRDVWQLYSENMRRLGSISYPYRFFEHLIQQTPSRHWISMARWNGKLVAGLVTFLFRDTVMPYFFGATDQAKLCHAANLLYLRAMQRGAEEGFSVFDFGRSRVDNTGSYNFKRFHGFEPAPLNYQIYVPEGCVAPQLSPDSRRFALARSIWKHLPLCLTQTIGSRLSHHLPG